MNQWEQKIRASESFLHKNRLTIHKDKTKSPKPDLLGYDNEDTMLAEFMTWANNTHIYPSLRRTVFHVENEGNIGGEEGARQGAQSKAKGKKKGVLDVTSVYLGVTCFLEFKLKSGTFSDEQLDFISDVTSWGMDVFIIVNFDFFKFVYENIVMKGVRLGGSVWVNEAQIRAKLGH